MMKNWWLYQIDRIIMIVFNCWNDVDQTDDDCWANNNWNADSICTWSACINIVDHIDQNQLSIACEKIFKSV